MSLIACCNGQQVLRSTCGTPRKRQSKCRETCGTPRKRQSKCRETCGTPANAKANAGRPADSPQTPKSSSRHLQQCCRHFHRVDSMRIDYRLSAGTILTPNSRYDTISRRSLWRLIETIGRDIHGAWEKLQQKGENNS